MRTRPTTHPAIPASECPYFSSIYYSNTRTTCTSTGTEHKASDEPLVGYRSLCARGQQIAQQSLLASAPTFPSSYIRNTHTTRASTGTAHEASNEPSHAYCSLCARGQQLTQHILSASALTFPSSYILSTHTTRASTGTAHEASDEPLAGNSSLCARGQQSLSNPC